MRQIRKTSSGDGVRGGFPKEGMKEGHVREWKRYSEEDIAYIKRRRAELVLEGKNDGQIGKILAGEMQRPAKSIDERIRKFIGLGEVGENPNKQNIFREEEVAKIKERRAELILEGKKDRTISGILAGEMKRSSLSIDGKIRELVKGEGLEKNPNKQSDFSEGEVARIKKRRAGLILEGKKDWSISCILAGEIKRPAGSINEKIRELVENGEIEENPGKRRRRGFSKEEVAQIKKRRAELVLEGKTDLAIAGVLAGEMERPAGGIVQRIRRLVENGGLEENPNKQSDFSEGEVARIKKRRAGLILEGKKDWSISCILAGEMKRSAGSMNGKIRKLVKSGELEENPNKQIEFNGEEIAKIKERRAGLILEGKTDKEISQILAGEMERSAGAILQKILELIESRELGENPHRWGRTFSEKELAAELSAAVDMYLGGG